MNWKKYFNIHNIIFSFILLIFTSIAVNLNLMDFGTEFIIGFLFLLSLGPHGWPFVFYRGGSLLPFLGGSSEAYFSLIKLLSDLVIFYLIVIISSFIASKIKKESKIIIFAISIVVVIVLAVTLGYTDSYNKKSHNLSECDLNNDSVCDNSDLEKFKTLYQEAKSSNSYNQTIDFDKDDRVEKSDWFMLNFLIGNLNQWPPAQEVFKTQKECELIVGIECGFQTCDYIPSGKTFEEVCGKDFKKGWVPKNPVLEQTSPEKQKINNTQPITATNYKIIGSYTSPGESSFVKALGNTAFLTDISEGFLAIDVSNPEKPVLLDKIKIAGGGAYALAIEPNGPFAVVGGYGNTKVALVDISNPKSLKMVNEIDAKRPVQDITLNVLEVNDLFFAIDGPEVEIMKVEDYPFSLKRIVSQGILEIINGGHINTLADYFDSTSNTPYLLLGQGESGISIYSFNLMTLSSQKLVTHISDIGYVNLVAADENYIYASAGNLIKVIDLKTQKQIADIKVDDVWNLKVKNNMLYVASGENGVKILDISDIKNPKEIAVIDTPGRARSIDVSMDGNYIYVADDRDDLQIIEAP